MNIQSINDAGTGVVAATAVASPLWLENLSGFASLVLPILGAVWLGVQIVFKIKEYRRGQRE